MKTELKNWSRAKLFWEAKVEGCNEQISEAVAHLLQQRDFCEGRVSVCNREIRLRLPKTQRIRTPNNIEVLLHYYVRSFEPHPRHFAPAVQEATVEFLQRGLIRRTGGCCYETTCAGQQVIENLCGVQI